MTNLSICDFEEAIDAQKWFSINDGVMGGLSSGSLVRVEPGSARFLGHVSLENNGGFASVRSRALTVSLAGYHGVELRVRGDGKKYKLRLKTDGGPEGFCYEIPFHPIKESWRIERLPFEKAKATFRGLSIPFVPSFNPEKIKSLG